MPNCSHIPLNKVARSAIGTTPTPRNSRPIRTAKDPLDAIKRVAEEIEKALKNDFSFNFNGKVVYQE